MLEGFGEWKSHIAEKLLSVLLIQVFFASKFVDNSQGYFWYSDRDAINDEGKERIKYVQDLFGHFMDVYQVNSKQIGLGTTFPNHNYFNDVMSIADLASGATLEFYEEQFGTDQVKESTNEILKWFASDHVPLRKLKLRVRLNDDGRRVISSIEYSLK